MMEMGFAAAILGWNRIILVLNKHYGSSNTLPFDLEHRRHPISYELGPDSGKREQVTMGLADELAYAIRAGLMAEYDLVGETLSRLTSPARWLMREFGNAPSFNKVDESDKFLSQRDYAVAQMLELNVIKCVDVTGELKSRYEWTYLGKRCCRRLNVVEPVSTPLLNTIDSSPQFVVEYHYLDMLQQQASNTNQFDDSGENENLSKDGDTSP